MRKLIVVWFIILSLISFFISFCSSKRSNTLTDNQYIENNDSMEYSKVKKAFNSADSILFYCFYFHYKYPLKPGYMFLEPTFGVQIQAKDIIENKYLYKKIIDYQEIIKVLNCFSEFKEIEKPIYRIRHQTGFAAVIYKGDTSDTLSYFNPELILNGEICLKYDKNPLDLLMIIFDDDFILCDLAPTLLLHEE